MGPKRFSMASKANSNFRDFRLCPSGRSTKSAGHIWEPPTSRWRRQDATGYSNGAQWLTIPEPLSSYPMLSVCWWRRDSMKMCEARYKDLQFWGKPPKLIEGHRPNQLEQLESFHLPSSTKSKHGKIMASLLEQWLLNLGDRPPTDCSYNP